jgi:translation initiation factor IF-3
MEKGLDLVAVAPNADPPVCRIMDYGKYKYEKNKKAKAAKKNQTIIQIKEIKLRPRTDEHDFNFKVKHMIKFLKEGSKVKVNIFLRGREIDNSEVAFNLVERIQEAVEEFGILESRPKLEGRIINLMFSPKKNKKGDK